MTKSKLKAIDPKQAAPAKPKILVFGAPGVGKTWGSLDWPSVFYVDTEGGANLPHYTDKLKAAGGGYLGPEHGANDFATINDQIIALTTENHSYLTFVLDSYSKPFNSAIGAEAERLGAKDAFGASKKPAIAASRRMVDRLDRLPMNAIIIAHEKPEWGVDASGQRTEVGKTYDGDEKLAYELHLVLHVQKRGNKRVAIVKKSRLLGFPEGEAIPWTFEEIASRYGRDVIEQVQPPIVLASAEQVAEVHRLFDTLKLEDGMREKWLANCKVDRFEDMSAEHIAAGIQKLKSKLPA